MHRLVRAFALSLALFSPSWLVASTPVAPQVLLGVAQPVVGKQFVARVLVKGPGNTLPFPAGTVTIAWGDDSQAESLTLVSSVAVGSHTYAHPGKYTITAAYNGDTNYSALQVSRGVLALTASPAAITLNAFGDSITWGRGASVPANAYADLVASDEGWTLNNQGVPSFTSTDVCATISSLSPLPQNSYNSMLVGQNDLAAAMVSPEGEAEFISAIASCSVWLATTQHVNRFAATDPQVTLSGVWTPSPYFPNTELMSVVPGSAVSGSVTGNVLYAQADSIFDASSTVSVSVDGGPAQPYVVPYLNYQGNRALNGPFGIRIPLSGTTAQRHTVKITCVDPGAAGCYVDWFAGNGLLSPSQPPYLWLATPYDSQQTSTTPAEYHQMQGFVREIQQQLAADGLNVYLADTAAWFNGLVDTGCMYDLIHPNDCGHAILATTFFNAMNSVLDTVSQTTLAISPAQPAVGQQVVLSATVAAASTIPSGTVTFSSQGQAFATVPLVNGIATTTQDTWFLPAATYSLSATYSGSGSVPGSASTINATLSPAATAVAFLATPTVLSAPAIVTLTAQVTRATGSGTPTGTVSFRYQSQLLGTSTLNANGTATLQLSSSGVPAGSYPVTATYSGDSSDAPATSPPSTITIQ